MKFADKIVSTLQSLGASFATLLKVVLLSRKPSGGNSCKDMDRRKKLIILANGPSLRKVLDEDASILSKHDLLTVNFMPLTSDFHAIKPCMHVLADGLFFAKEKQGNVRELWEALAKVDWEMTLWIPVGKGDKDIISLPECVTVKYFNLTPAEGLPSLTHKLFDLGLAMPRPRNVLIPSIMIGIREGYKDIYLCGADHSWSRTLWVDEDNLVVTVQPHFYKDNEKEHKRVESLYKNIRLHEIFRSFSIAFRSYWDIKRYAERKGVRIINATPGSYIDAFPRSKLESI